MCMLSKLLSYMKHLKFRRWGGWVALLMFITAIWSYFREYGVAFSPLQLYPYNNFMAPINNNMTTTPPSNTNECNNTQQSPPRDGPTSYSSNKPPWYVEGRTFHYPVLFPRCSMDACFDYKRCANHSELLVYSYTVPSPPIKYFVSINRTVWHTDDPNEACLFFVYLDLDLPHRPHPRSLPHWGDHGMNHVLITLADKWHQRGPPQDSIGYASVLMGDMHETIYRPGFDISIPAAGRVHLTHLQAVPPMGRKYLATFRGTRYVGVPWDEGVVRSSDAFRSLHNKKDVIVVTSCKHATNDLIRRENASMGKNCEEDEAEHAQYNYGELMNSTFGLVVAGRSPNSYRLVEVLSAGAVPVFIVENYVKPFDTLVQWHRCALQFPSSQMDLIVPALRAMVARPDADAELSRRQSYCIYIYNNFLRDDPTILGAVMDSLKARFYGAFPSFTLNSSLYQ